MAFDLTTFEPRVCSRQGQWEALTVEVVMKPITTGFDKNSTAVELDNDSWLASLTVWESGELDLVAARKGDGWFVSRHYNLDTVAAVDAVLAEVIALIRDGQVPADALSWWR